MKNAWLWICVMLVSATGCKPSKPQVWIYTSIYKEVVAELEKPLSEAVPEVEIRWFQSGSETIASKVSAELLVGRSRADLILTSDPFWYQELKNAGHLMPYRSPESKYVPTDYQDPDNAFTTVRLPVLVMSYNSKALTEAEAPHSWKDLLQPQWKNKIAMGSPLESGASFTGVSLLSKKLGWEYFESLKKQNVMVGGGNSTVLNRIETQERLIGLLLLENILKAQGKGSPVRPIYPSEGPIPVSSPIAILKTTRQPEAVKKIYDWFFGLRAQEALVHSGMYSFHPNAGTPPHGRELKEAIPVQGPKMNWNPGLLQEIFSQRQAIKIKFSEMFLHE